MLKKRYLFLIMLFCLFTIAAASAEEIDSNLSNYTIPASADSDDVDCTHNDGNITLSNEQDANDEELESQADSSLNSTNKIIYFDASASTNGDGSQTNPYKYVNQNTLKNYIGSEDTLTAYFADGTYNLNTNFIIKSPNVVLIGSENTIFNSALSNKYDFEIMKDSTLQLVNINFNHINIMNHGTLKAYDANFKNSASFTGKNAPRTYNTTNYNSSYGGVILCDPIGSAIPYLYLENCVFYNNTAYCGGAVSLKNSRIVVNNTRFYVSQGERKGGVIYAFNSSMNIIDSLFYANNATYGGVIYCEESDLHLRDTFLNVSVAYSFGGAISSRYSNINIDSTIFNFYGSFTDGGGAIYNFKGNLDINNSTFYRGSGEFGGVICNLQSNLTICSSFFKNNTAGHGGAIYNIYGKMYIENNTFYNSSAYDGSVLCSKLSDKSYLINNTFVNSPTRLNASCIFLDACAEELIQYGNHFEDRFYIQIEILDTVDDTEFALESNILTYALSNTGNYYDTYETADSIGGSSNYADINIYDASHPNNTTIYRNYNDDFEVVFNLTTHTNNFHNPMLKFRIYNYLGDLIYNLLVYVENNTLGSGKGAFPCSLKPHMLLNINSRLTVEDALVSSIQTTLSDLNYIPYSYDSRDYGYITPVKDQGEGGNCWAFAGIATLEACIKKITGITYDFSEENMKNMMAAFSTMGLDIQPNDGGIDSMVMGYLTSWFGPVVEATDIYDEFSSLSTPFYPKFHVQNICFLPPRENGQYDYLYKKAIMDYGAVAITFEIAPKNLHSITLIGWDDNYRGYDSFDRYAKGAWIIKNSWGTDWGDNGFGYLSYSTHFTSDDYINWHAYSFIFSENDNYLVNVNPDFSGVNNYIFNDGPITCSIKVNGPEHVYSKLAAFATYFKIPTEYEITIYDLNKAGSIIFYQEGYSEAGYHTIPLSREITVNPGALQLVSITFNNEDENYLPVCQAERLTKAHFQQEGQFFYSDTYITGADLIDLKVNCIFIYNGTLANTCQVPSIHLLTNNAFSYEAALNVSEITSVNAGENVYINVTFSNIWSITNEYQNTLELMEGSLVTIKINGKNYYAMIHDGKACLKVKFDKGGDYTLSAQYKNNKFTSNVVEYDFKVKKVKSSITAKSVSKIYGGNEKSVITLKDNNGKPIPNTAVTFNIGGKTTTIKTNSKGEATMALSMAPKTYTATVKYNGNDKYLSSTTKVKVVVKKATPRIVASKKTFKVAAKTKKYTIVMKDNLGKAMKNTYVKITVNGKTYSAKTNSKGQATFNLNKLTKKGNFFATIKYAGSSYYNAVTKKVTISVVK